MHYNRWYQHGDPTVIKRQSGRVCVVEGCGKPHQARGWCWTHYERWRVHGDPEFEAPHSQWLGDEVGYKGLHQRLIRGRGQASQYPCVDCGGTAEHWSLRKDHAGQLQKDELDRIWTILLEDYDPRCIPCHRGYDKDWGGPKGAHSHRVDV
jgi:hypothetical protein